MYYYVYQIRNLINGKVYVGKHKSPNQPLENGYYGSGKQIKAAIKKYGKGNFTKEVLHYCSSLIEMSDKEAEIVTEDFVKRKDTYNMHKGGPGGFEHINNDPVARARVSKICSDFNKANKIGGSKLWTEEIRAKVLETGKKNLSLMRLLCNSDAAKEKRKKTFVEIKHQQKEKNSQFGRGWISNLTTKEVKRIDIIDSIPNGWVRGKKGHLPKKLWVNNGSKEHYILVGKEQEYMLKGFSRGRVKTSMPRK